MRKAKGRKLPVSCGVSINHLVLNESDIGSYRTFFKVRPPLRREDDRVAMVKGVASGEIDVIVSSHDPQDADEKRRPFSEAADGANGLETLLAAGLKLYHSDQLSLLAFLRALTINPARLLGLPSGRLAKGAPADLVLFDPNETWALAKDSLRSRSKKSPFDETTLQGRVLRTLVAGEKVYRYAGVERT